MPMAIRTTPTKRVGLAVTGYPGCFERELEHMQDLLPDRGSWPSLDPGDQFPVDPEKEQAKECGKNKFCDHFSTR